MDDLEWAYWCVDERWLMTACFQFGKKAKQALFDTGNHSAAGNLSSFESLQPETFAKMRQIELFHYLALILTQCSWLHQTSG